MLLMFYNIIHFNVLHLFADASQKGLAASFKTGFTELFKFPRVQWPGQSESESPLAARKTADSDEPPNGPLAFPGPEDSDNTGKLALWSVRIAGPGGSAPPAARAAGAGGRPVGHSSLSLRAAAGHGVP